jgi:hypothetical protein
MEGVRPYRLSGGDTAIPLHFKKGMPMIMKVLPWSASSQKVADAIKLVELISNPNDVIPALLYQGVNVMVVHEPPTAEAPLTIYVDEFRFSPGNKS